MLPQPRAESMAIPVDRSSGAASVEYVSVARASERAVERRVKQTCGATPHGAIARVASIGSGVPEWANHERTREMRRQ